MGQETMEIIENWSRLNQNEPEIKMDMYVHVCNIHHISCHGNGSVWKTWPRGWIINSKVWKTAVVYIRDQGSNSFTDNTLNSNYQLTKQDGLVCSQGPMFLIYIAWLEYLISGLKSYWDFRETGSPQNISLISVFQKH